MKSSSNFPAQAVVACVVAAGLWFGPISASAQESSDLADLASEKDPPVFDSPDKAVKAFKNALADNDFKRVAALLGLDATRLKAAEGVRETYDQIRAAAARQVVVTGDDNQKIISIGDDLWPIPFPVSRGDDGKWAFDTYAGIEEVINRRIGENETEAITVARAYVDAQEDYADEDRDGDGVNEYAQKLISSEGQTDGLYWPEVEGNSESPAGPFVDAGAIEKAKAGGGYFGYRFRILTGQGDNIAGGRYSYIVNGNMVGGFGLVAWPVKYEETGVKSFVVNTSGIVYERDLGADTETAAAAITVFDPDDDWTIVEE